VGPVDPQRLNRLLGAPELAWILDRARRRMERGEPLEGTVTRSTATVAERDAAARLLGRPLRPARGLSVPLEEIDAILRRAGIHDGGLAGAVITLTGPVSVRSELASAEALAWAAAFAPLEAAVARRAEVAGPPEVGSGVSGGRTELSAWLAHLRSSGLIKRLAGGSAATGAELLSGLARVLHALPCQPVESLAAFAARVVGRAHALDDGTPLGTLAHSAARALAGLAPIQPGESPSEARREAWAAVGVLCDELSSVVLTLGLTGDRSAGGGVLAAARRTGEPVWLTLRQLVRTPPVWEGVESALIVENPSVVALAADRPGPPPFPLISTHGQPRAAAMVLLRSLAAAGVRLGHHGDFDWPGITIANLLHRRLPVEPWQFSADAYRDAARTFGHTAKLTGEPVLASWDPALTAVMTATGRQIEEELVAPLMLDEFQRGSG
jgi:uncharacterized protein (TIGR02679 family)